jgi:hypothetical protein
MIFNARVKILSCLMFFLSILGISSASKIFITPKTYVFDWKYSLFLQNPENVCYTAKNTLKTSSESEVIFAKIMNPVFEYKRNNEIIFLSEKCEEIKNISKKQDFKLVSLQCDENFTLAINAYNNLKKLHLVSMKLIDNRRWQIVILKHERIITIDFPGIIPNVEEFQSLDEKYNLTKKYTHIDLRFKEKIGVFE